MLLPTTAFPMSAAPAAQRSGDAGSAEVICQFLERGWDFEIGKTIEETTRRFGKPISLQRRRTAGFRRFLLSFPPLSWRYTESPS